MPIARFQMPDGRVARFEVPEGTTPEQAQAMIAAEIPKITEPLTRGDKLKMGATDIVHGGAQLLTKMLPDGVVKAGNNFNNWLADKTGLVAKLPEGGVDQQVREREADYQARRAAAGESGIDGWRMTGGMIPAVLAPQIRAATLPGQMAVGAGYGAFSGAMSPVTEDGDFASQKAKQVAIGTGLGGATPVIANGVARMVSPKASVNPDLNLLKREGVKPTIGQTLGGTANAIEEKATSLPFVGDAISAARNRAKEQFNQAAINRATAPVGKQVTGSGTEAVKQAGDMISDAYNAAKSQLGGFRIDQQANSELSHLRMLASSGLQGRERSTFNRYFNDYLKGNVGFTADKFKEFDSKIGSDIARFGQGDAYQQKLGDALQEIKRIVFENAKRANPDAAKALKAADEAWANLVRIEGASVAAKGTEGVFTPGQLMTAVRGADKSVRDRATARGTALMQDLAGAGTKVLGNKIPDSGTAGRLLPYGAGLGAAAYDPMLTGSLLLGGVTAYTSPVQTLLRGLASSRPQLAQPAAQAIRQAGPGFGLLSGQVVGQLGLP